VTSPNHSPGEPPGAKTQESATPPIASSPEAPTAKLALAESASADGEPARAAPKQTFEAVIEPQRGPPSTPETAAQPPAAVDAARDERETPPRAALAQGWLSSRSAAPVEDRSVTLALAAAPAATGSGSGAARLEQPRSDDSAARRTFVDTVPRMARQGELEVSRVLSMAASAYWPTQDRAVADAARTTRIRDEASLVRTTAPAEARRLHDRAHAAFASGRNVSEALDLQQRAFAANPRDPEIAGFLSVLYLRLTPSQPERARQLALIALTARAPQYATTRIEDWYTLAAASALSGREADARNALFVTLTLSASLERTCVTAWNMFANYGERMRGPVDAVLYRVHTRGHSDSSPWCAWPPVWSTPPRLAGSG